MAVTITQVSAFGFFTIIVALVILWQQCYTFWRKSYLGIGSLVLVAIFLKVFFDFILTVIMTTVYPNMTAQAREKFEIGFDFWQHHFQYFSGSGNLHSHIYALTVMLFLCLLSKYMSRYDSIFKDSEAVEDQES